MVGFGAANEPTAASDSVVFERGSRTLLTNFFHALYIHDASKQLAERYTASPGIVALNRAGGVCDIGRSPSSVYGFNAHDAGGATRPASASYRNQPRIYNTAGGR
jgi:hypothetical protein